MSKADILAAIRRAKPAAAPLPSLDGLGAPCADLRTAFMASLQAVVGQPALIPGRGALAEAVRTRHPDAAVVYSSVPEIPNHGFALPADGDPHAFAPVDLAIVPGEFGVAENGAIWVSSAAVPHRISLFLAQHLAIVLPATALVPHMHAAYAHIAESPLPDFGVFISGPSKTADIEQCLVIGAHGARSLTVFLVG